jgi:indolepyruvate ferredoxin oxidoreductase
MNAPLPDHLLKALQTVTLDDKYALDHGHAFMSGVQALVRLPMLQRVRDQRLGKNTAGFISGYRGSPLGTYDQSLQKAEKFLKAHHVVFQPGVNEELAATAIWGTQQLGFAPQGSNKYDGVFGIWYGKGPGVDRCSDVFKHANMAGTTPWGGVIAVAGDDHISKSSTAAHQSDHIFKACGTPVFFPANVQEILDLGIHAFAMSRFSGVWAGMKTIQEIVESSATAMIDPDRVQIRIPTDFVMPPGGVHIRWPDAALEQEARLFDYKWYAALAYIRANRLNYNVIEGPNDRLGLIASGKAYNDTRQALLDLGLDDATCRRVGIRLHKVGVVWPLEAQLTREFATGLQEILVVEEKRQVIEYQLKEGLYNWRADVRPRVLGKFNEAESDASGFGSGGEWGMANPHANTLLRANADLSPAIVARAIARRLTLMGVDSDISARIDAQLAILNAKESAMQVLEVNRAKAEIKLADRQPWFCSGCPHNTSTKVPEGSRAMAGIGCHFMTVWMNRSTVGFTQMGGEGVPWVGQQPFSNDQHMFANLGDGTYFHSGLLAVRQSIAAGVNITYKILYNDAVAMTGGQQVGERPEGHSVVQIAQSMRAEGAVKIVVVTDEPEKYQGVELAPGVAVHHRDALDTIQKEFREIKGTTVIIYDQTCATEKRRRRKRGTMVDPTRRVVINELVCEGCGDCGVQSNCVSVEPLETEFGRKRQINQSTCNKDFSCVKGFCPSFVTVEGGQLRKKGKSKSSAPELGPLPEPVIPQLAGTVADQSRSGAWGIIVAGVGGTGVITIGQLLGVAAHSGRQRRSHAGCGRPGSKGWCNLEPRADCCCAGRHPHQPRQHGIGRSGNWLRPDCGGGQGNRAAHAPGSYPCGTEFPQCAYRSVCLPTRTGPIRVMSVWPKFPAWWVRTALGCLTPMPLPRSSWATAFTPTPSCWAMPGKRAGFRCNWSSLIRAIELNAVAVENNKAAFAWGRKAALDWPAVQKMLNSGQVVSFLPRSTLSVEDLVAKRVEFLTGYQNAAYAASYAGFVEQVRRAEEGLSRRQR